MEVVALLKGFLQKILGVRLNKPLDTRLNSGLLLFLFPLLTCKVNLLQSSGQAERERNGGNGGCRLGKQLRCHKEELDFSQLQQSWSQFESVAVDSPLNRRVPSAALKRIPVRKK